MKQPRNPTTRLGRPRGPPEKVKGQLAIRIPPADRELLQILAARDGVSMSAYVLAVLQAHMREEDT